jgi:hypothetical protein
MIGFGCAIGTLCTGGGMTGGFSTGFSLGSSGID